METKQAVLPLSAPVSTSILLCFGNRHNHITVFDETIFVSSMTLYQQAVQTYIHLLILRCKNACWGMPQAPLICIFQCRLRIPSGRFLPGDVLRVVKNLHEVRSGFCKRIVLHLFRNWRFQKRNAPRLHTVRKFFLCLQCRHLTHIRGSFCIQNIGCGVFSVAVFRLLHHGVVLIPKVTEANSATDVLHFDTQFFIVAPLRSL